MKRRYSFSRDVLVPYLVSKSDRRGSDFSNRQLAIFSGDVVGRSSVLDGWYAQDEISALLEFLAANAVDAYSGVCVDVGANVGSHSIPLANVFTRVIAIEPHPETYRLLHLNVERLNNVIALQLAISDTTGTELLTVPDNLHSSALLAKNGEIEVNSSRLDDLDFGGEKVSFIKIDVEGLEELVVEGGRGIIGTFQPIVAFEMKSSEAGRGEPAVMTKLRELGYEQFLNLDRGPKLPAWLPSVVQLSLRVMSRLIFGLQVKFVALTQIDRPHYDLVLALPKPYTTGGFELQSVKQRGI